MTRAISLSPTGFNVLRALATFRFLTVDQMVRLGVAKDKGNLRKVLSGMVSANMDKQGIPRVKEIGYLDFGVLPGRGRLSRLYYLAPKGAELLQTVDPSGEEPRPIRHAVRFQNDYFHRVHTVDFHITVAQFADLAGHEITLARQYFDRLEKTGRTPPRPSTSIKTRTGFLDPDSIFMLRDESGTERLLLVEIANGIAVDRVVKKMSRYAKAIAQNEINAAFDYGDRAPRVLWLFEQRKTMELVQARSAENSEIQTNLPYFFLRTLPEISPIKFVNLWERALVGRMTANLF